MNIPSLPFDRSSLVLSWYGNRFAIGGTPDVLSFIANILSNYDPTPANGVRERIIAEEFAHDKIRVPVTRETVGLLRAHVAPDYRVDHRGSVEIHHTHKNFGYVLGDEETLIRAFELLRRSRIPRTGKFKSLRRQRLFARKLAVADFASLKRENFLLGQNEERNGFAASFEQTARTVAGPSVDGDDNGCWQQTAIGDGVNRADSELLEKGAKVHAH